MSRGEVADSKGHIARQADVVIYDAQHSPLLQRSEGSQLFASESVYAVIEMKPILNAQSLPEAVEAVRSAKALDRSAVVGAHEGHRLLHGPAGNPPMFGAIFSLKAPNVEKCVVPALGGLHERLPWEQRVDAICVLGEALVYHFQPAPQADGELGWSAAVAGEGTTLGYYAAGEDTLLYFYLFLLYQLGMRELFPPDFLRYMSGVPGPPLHIYQAKRVWPWGKPMPGAADQGEGR